MNRQPRPEMQKPPFVSGPLMTLPFSRGPGSEMYAAMQPSRSIGIDVLATSKGTRRSGHHPRQEIEAQGDVQVCSAY